MVCGKSSTHIHECPTFATHRTGEVQLIDATQWFKPLRKNLSKKNCELSDADIQRIKVNIGGEGGIRNRVTARLDAASRVLVTKK
jgi:type I restriction-modification system DNA methylase subunit